MWNLRRDDRGLSAVQMVAALIAVLIAVIIGTALMSTVLSQIDTVNDTADYATGSPVPGLANLVPLFWILGIALAAVAIVFVALRSGLGD